MQAVTEVISEGAEGIILELVLEGYAEYYSADLSEKIVRGLTENALKGKAISGCCTLGYTLDEDRHFQIDPIKTPFILEAFKKYDEGATIKEIQDWPNECGVKNSRGKKTKFESIREMLRNRRYIGEYKFRDILLTDAIPPIVPKDLFERVQMKLEKNKKAPARHKAEDDYLLTTKLYCGNCGAFMFGESGHGRNGTVYHYYKCRAIKKRYSACNKKSVVKGWIEDLVVNKTMSLIMDDDVN